MMSREEFDAQSRASLLNRSKGEGEITEMTPELEEQYLAIMAQLAQSNALKPAERTALVSLAEEYKNNKIYYEDAMEQYD
jgi:hypothetical protein